jgi:hypothetical protein
MRLLVVFPMFPSFRCAQITQGLSELVIFFVLMCLSLGWTLDESFDFRHHFMRPSAYSSATAALAATQLLLMYFAHSSEADFSQVIAFPIAHARRLPV